MPQERQHLLSLVLAVVASFEFHDFRVIERQKAELPSGVEHNEQVFVDFANPYGVVKWHSRLNRDLLALNEATRFEDKLHQMVVCAEHCQLAAFTA